MAYVITAICSIGFGGLMVASYFRIKLAGKYGYRDTGPRAW